MCQINSVQKSPHELEAQFGVLDRAPRRGAAWQRLHHPGQHSGSGKSGAEELRILRTGRQEFTPEQVDRVDSPPANFPDLRALQLATNSLDLRGRNVLPHTPDRKMW